jgi:uncharacterized protein (DUF2236 family)
MVRMHEVGAEELERALEWIAGDVRDPRAGLFGPSSEVWRKNGEAIVFAGAGRAALLQLAHPAVAQAVEEFSITRHDRLARFRKTFYYVFAMVFGDLETALSMARTVHRMHQRVRGRIRDDDAGPLFPSGTPFFANHPKTQLWVASTLFDSSAWVFERLVRPLTEVEKARWMGEYPRFCSLFGIPTSMVPSTFLDFQAYNARMWQSDVLTVGSTARSLKEVLVRAPSRALAPFWSWYAAFTAGSLPPRIRAQYGFAWGRTEEALFASSIRALRALRRAVPPPLRTLPVYRRALARCRDRAPSRIDQALERLFFGELAPTTSDRRTASDRR